MGQDVIESLKRISLTREEFEKAAVVLLERLDLRVKKLESERDSDGSRCN